MFLNYPNLDVQNEDSKKIKDAIYQLVDKLNIYFSNVEKKDEEINKEINNLKQNNS